MNSTVGLIFNKKVAEKCNLWVCEQCTDALFTVEKITNAGLKKKRKKKEKGKTRILAKCGRVTLNPNGTFVYCLILNESRLFTLKIIIIIIIIIKNYFLGLIH